MREVSRPGANVEDAHGAVGGVAGDGGAGRGEEGLESRGVHVWCGDCGAPSDGLWAVFVGGGVAGAILPAVDLGG